MYLFFVRQQNNSLELVVCNTTFQTTMAYITYMNSMMNMLNDMRRDILSEAMHRLESDDLLTNEVKTVLTNMMSSPRVKKDRKVSKKKTPRFSGYHIFMKEHRVMVKNENPGIKPQRLTTIVAKAWKHVSEDEKRKLNERALRMKEAFNNNNNGEEIVIKKKKEQKVNKKVVEKPVVKEEIKKEELSKEYTSELDSESEESDDSDDDTTDLALESESDDE